MNIINNFAEFFIESMKLYKGRNAIYWRQANDSNSHHEVKYNSISGDKIKELVYILSKEIEKFKLNPGDKTAIISESRFEWVIADFACIMNMIETIPIYTTMTSSQMMYILEHSEAKLCFTSTKLITDKVKAIINELPKLKQIISFNKTGTGSSNVIDFEDLIYNSLIDSKDIYNESEADKYFCECGKKISPDDILTIIYTSGTTGNPKGVSLTHKNILSNVESCSKAFPINSSDRFLSFLPLAHSYEKTTGYYFAMSVGAEIYYGQNIDTLPLQFLEVKPTLITSVPLLFTRIYNRIEKNINSSKGISKIIGASAFNFAKKDSVNKSSYLWKFFDKNVYRKIKERMGGKAEILISGGSALNKDAGRFFNNIGLNVYEGYGLTEASPVISVNRPGKNKIGTVGLPLDGVEVRINGDGEILVKGDNVMKGYYKDEEQTRAAIIGGWLHTGDIGEFDPEGFLKITDRKKSLIKTEGGKYISLTHIEETLENSEYISQVIAFAGDDKPFVSALIVPNFDEIKNYSKENNINYDNLNALINNPQIKKLFESEILKYQKEQAKYERVRKFVLMDHEFSIDSGEITPTLKLKRKVIENKYKELIENLYKLN